MIPTFPNPVPAKAKSTPVSFQRYYQEAGPDYAAWSPNFNMHFGYYRHGMNPFDREAMLQEMNRQILDRLHLEDTPHLAIPVRVLDMGCGLGATLRSFAGQLPRAELFGITLVPWQLEQGHALNAGRPDAQNITLALGDYERTTFPAAFFHGVYALESSCYARGSNKSAFLKEAHRLLRPGGRIVIADGFLGRGKLRGPQRSIYRKLCECWVIEDLGEIDLVKRELERIGFRDIVIERKQARVTPSVLHVPWVTLKFLLTTLVSDRRKMTRARWNNVLAPILLPFVGLPVGPMAYYIVSATRI